MRKLFVIAIFFGGLAAVAWPAFAQEIGSSDASDDFQISKSVGIGLTGFSTSTDYSLIDSHDVPYDTMSLLKTQQVREEAGVSEDDYADMWEARTEMIEEMESLTLSAIYDGEQRDKLKSMFIEADAEFQAMLNADQLSKLCFERARIGIEQVGPIYLADPVIARTLGLSEKVAEQISQRSERFLKSHKARKRELLNAANQKLIESLTESQQSELESLLTEKLRSKFLVHELFQKNKVERGKSIRLGLKQFFMLRSRSVQRKLELSENQVDRFKTLNRRDPELDASLRELLTDEQSLELFQLALNQELKKAGTVNLLSDGIVGQKLKLSVEQSDDVFELGKDTHADLISQYSAASRNLLVEEFEVPSDHASKIAEILSR